jgi:hypothetical protein
MTPPTPRPQPLFIVRVHYTATNHLTNETRVCVSVVTPLRTLDVQHLSLDECKNIPAVHFNKLEAMGCVNKV